MEHWQFQAWNSDFRVMVAMSGCALGISLGVIVALVGIPI